MKMWNLVELRGLGSGYILEGRAKVSESFKNNFAS